MAAACKGYAGRFYLGSAPICMIQLCMPGYRWPPTSDEQRINHPVVHTNQEQPGTRVMHGHLSNPSGTCKQCRHVPCLAWGGGSTAPSRGSTTSSLRGRGTLHLWILSPHNGTLHMLWFGPTMLRGAGGWAAAFASRCPPGTSFCGVSSFVFCPIQDKVILAGGALVMHALGLCLF